MALVEELVAQLRATIEQSGQAQGSIEAARAQIELAIRQFQTTADGSSNNLVPETLTAWRESLDKLDEAKALMAAGGVTTERYIAILTGTSSTGGSSTGGGQRPSPPSLPVKGPAKKGVVRPPHDRRHLLWRIDSTSEVKKRNTVILPSVDIDADLEAIRTGHAKWLPEKGRYEINGRLWGIERNGTTYPESGPGFITLNRREYRALCGLVEYEGERPFELTMDPNITEEDWQRAEEVYRHHPDYDQGVS